MPQNYIRITSRPAGDAPDAIRDQWIGLVLPVHKEATKPPTAATANPNVELRGGYEVRLQDALRILGHQHPDARDWWQRNTMIVFEKTCCKLATDFEL